MKIIASIMAAVGLTSATALATTFATACVKEADCTSGGDTTACCGKFWVQYTVEASTYKGCMTAAQRSTNDLGYTDNSSGTDVIYSFACIETTETDAAAA